MQFRQLLLLLPCLVLLVALLAPAGSAEFACNSERQVVSCGQLPVETASQQAEYIACCQANVVTPAAAAEATRVAAAAAVVRQELQPAQMRPDLDPNGPRSTSLNFRWGSCLKRRLVVMPTFVGTSWTTVKQTVPSTLSRNVINSVRDRALSILATRAALSSVHNTYASITSVNAASSFVHPAGLSGPAELATLRFRVANPNFRSPQLGAFSVLLSGEGVPPKTYPGGWAPPTNCPAEGYAGPLAMSKVQVLYGGREADSANCPANFPAGAPRDICGHISFVEMDGQMAIKQAMAYWATSDMRYANNALSIIEAWTNTNAAFGLQKENGPLEAGWGLACMAKALELLRDLPRGRAILPSFVAYVDNILMPLMDTYVIGMTITALRNGAKNVYGNWHTTIADAMISFGVLADDRGRYNIGTELFMNATRDYLKWGRGMMSTVDGVQRIPGECTETLRDIYHAEFGLGSALQAAEMAFQQGDDLYMAGGHALASAMELHARIIMADKKKEEPPLGFKWYNDGKGLPPAPAGTEYRFDMAKQLWVATDKTTFKPVPGGELRDGVKYLLGVKFLPTGAHLA
eukprot:GHRQ01016219.1.p1 GENE.GHRQ01016219.1~~GHRQ01016219.1.p1  ORF type:complete len:577 (+),score=184.85 GHRQ01016219.1:303-2033(+)